MGRSVAVLLVAVGMLFSSGLSAGGAESRLDLNAATVEELASLPGIGPAKAQAIVDRRSEAPFVVMEDVIDVPGIGPALLERFRDRVEIGEVPDQQARRSKRPR